MTTRVRPGDRIAVARRRVGERGRRGQVVEVLGEPGRERCRVRWEDGQETLVYGGREIELERPTPERREEVK